jgi:hypothetical protein
MSGLVPIAVEVLPGWRIQTTRAPNRGSVVRRFRSTPAASLALQARSRTLSLRGWLAEYG